VSAAPDTAAVPEALGPLDAPHDRLPFDELARLYNFRRTSDWQALFARLLIDECRRRPSPVVALDVGCGHGIGRKPHYTAEVRKVVDEFWGLEPDPSVSPPEGVFDHYQNAVMEDADLPEDHFDVAYSFMVVEHVEHPEAYLGAVARCLKPGGVHFFITVNGAHYFALCASAMKAMHLDEAVLRLIRGRQEVEEYHYPVQYKMNRPRVIDRFAREAGFEPPEYVFVEERGPEPYMRGPLRLAWHAMNLKRRVLKDPGKLLALYCRMRKAGGASA
jgi:SAM-dependent methyltransferase